MSEANVADPSRGGGDGPPWGELSPGARPTGAVCSNRRFWAEACESCSESSPVFACRAAPADASGSANERSECCGPVAGGGDGPPWGELSPGARPTGAVCSNRRFWAEACESCSESSPVFACRAAPADASGSASERSERCGSPPGVASAVIGRSRPRRADKDVFFVAKPLASARSLAPAPPYSWRQRNGKP